MRLSQFILEHMDAILKDWDAFARTQLPAAETMSASELRDHARQVLQTSALDMETDQSLRQQRQKSQGLDPQESEDDDSAASVHGSLRQLSGFTVSQLIAEFRALRASVLRLWLKQLPACNEAAVDEMVRFNESIDQALAESAATFTHNMLRTRDTFLAILGHDLRTPLSTMALSGELLTRPGLGDARTREAGARVRRSAAVMSSMVVDLLEYSRTQLGAELPIDKEPADVEAICRASCDDSSAAYPECTFEIEASGDTRGCFDAVRLQQLFSNLMNNAAQYRSPEHPVLVVVRGDCRRDGDAHDGDGVRGGEVRGDEVRGDDVSRNDASGGEVHDAGAPSGGPHGDCIEVQVKNRGPVIPAAALQAIFDPLVRLSRESHRDGRPSTSLGLGLFIARQVALAHGGSIHADSTPGSGTVFTVRLPRK